MQKRLARVAGLPFEAVELEVVLLLEEHQQVGLGLQVLHQLAEASDVDVRVCKADSGDLELVASDGGLMTVDSLLVGLEHLSFFLLGVSL